MEKEKICPICEGPIEEVQHPHGHFIGDGKWIYSLDAWKEAHEKKKKNN